MEFLGGNVDVGSYALEEGVEGGTITLSGDDVPRQVKLQVKKPDGGLELRATAVEPFASDAIQFTLSGITDGPGYVLEWMATFDD